MGARLEPRSGLPVGTFTPFPHTRSPHPVFQGLQVEFVPDAGQGVDGLAEHCGEERERFAGASGHPTWFQPPVGPDSPFTLLPVTRHFMLPAVTGMGRAGGFGPDPSSTIRSGSLPRLRAVGVPFPRTAPGSPAPAL